MDTTTDVQKLRPIERRVLSMKEEGLTVEEIASKIKRSPDHVRRLIDWAQIPRTGASRSTYLRAIERRVLQLRAKGESHEQIGRRFNRGARHIRQIEGLAHYKEGLRLLSEG